MHKWPMSNCGIQSGEHRAVGSDLHITLESVVFTNANVCVAWQRGCLKVCCQGKAHSIFCWNWFKAATHCQSHATCCNNNHMQSCHAISRNTMTPCMHSMCSNYMSVLQFETYKSSRTNTKLLSWRQCFTDACVLGSFNIAGQKHWQKFG